MPLSIFSPMFLHRVSHLMGDLGACLIGGSLGGLLGSPPSVPHSPHAGWRAVPLPSGEVVWVWAAGPYAGEIGEAIRRSKFSSDWIAVQALCGRLRRIHGSGIWSLRPTVVPIPADPKRLGQRGLHLPVLLAKALSRDRRLILDRLGLLKLRSTPSQAQSRSGREGLAPPPPQFRAQSRLAGQCVVLVDDVLTTGQTLEAAISALRTVGAQAVGAVVLAHQARRTCGRRQHTPVGHTSRH